MSYASQLVIRIINAYRAKHGANRRWSTSANLWHLFDLSATGSAPQVKRSMLLGLVSLAKKYKLQKHWGPYGPPFRLHPSPPLFEL